MNSTEAPVHTPVMTREVVASLNVRPGGRYVDCTVDGGGHAAAMMEAASPGGSLLGIDLDPELLEIARRRLSSFGRSVRLVEGNFAEVERICGELHFAPVHGVLFDLGLSSFALDTAERGFSLRREGPLDMRFSPHQELTAAQIVNSYSEGELADVLRRFGEEPQARKIARYIVEHRPFETTTELANAVEKAVGRRARRQTHPATRTFQALRIAVNQELLSLEAALPQACGLLGDLGRLAVLSYHSLEDRVVKEFIRRESRDCLCPPRQPVCTCGHRAILRPVTRGALRPSEDEVAANPRARSARLRAAERLAASR